MPKLKPHAQSGRLLFSNVRCLPSNILLMLTHPEASKDDQPNPPHAVHTENIVDQEVSQTEVLIAPLVGDRYQVCGAHTGSGTFLQLQVKIARGVTAGEHFQPAQV